MPVRPASRKKSATTDQPHAESVPSEISVSIVAAAWRRFFHAATWNGQPAQSTTGVASCSASHCQCVNWSAETIPISRVGRESTAAKTSRRRSARRRVLLDGGRLRVREARGVADLLDGVDQRVGRHLRRVVLDGCLLGCVVDRRGDAVELVQLALDARRRTRRRSSPRSAARGARSRRCSSCDLDRERGRVHDAVDLELEEEAVAARGGQLRVEDDLADLRVGLGMHVRVREVAVAQRDEVPAMTDVVVERRDGLAVAADREVELRRLCSRAARRASARSRSRPRERCSRTAGSGAGLNAPATKRSWPRTVFVPPTSKSA